MTLNGLEPPKYRVLVNFSRFWAATQISKVNCAEIAADRQNNLLSIKVSPMNANFSSSSPDLLRSNKPVHAGVKVVLT